MEINHTTVEHRDDVALQVRSLLRPPQIKYRRHPLQVDAVVRTQISAGKPFIDGVKDAGLHGNGGMKRLANLSHCDFRTSMEIADRHAGQQIGRTSLHRHKTFDAMPGEDVIAGSQCTVSIFQRMATEVIELPLGIDWVLYDVIQDLVDLIVLKFTGKPLAGIPCILERGN